MSTNNRSGAERLFDDYRNLTSAERRDFHMLVKGFDLASAPKDRPQPPAMPRKPKSEDAAKGV